MCRASTLLAELEDDEDLPEPDEEMDDNEDDLKDDEEYDDVMVCLMSFDCPLGNDSYFSVKLTKHFGENSKAILLLKAP
jgi:hypothetical protein